MKVLIISNMYPSAQKPYSGLFVVNQVNEIKQLIGGESKVDFYYMKRTFTGKMGSLLKYIKFFINFFFYCFKQKEKYHIVHIHYFYPTIFLGIFYKFFFNKKVKIIATFHGGDYYKTKKNYLYKYSLNLVDQVIAVSTELKNSISKYYQNKIIVIPAGVNSVFQEQKIKTKKKYDLIYIGSFYRVKGFDILCEFLLQLKSPISICIIGSGELEFMIDKVKEKTQHEITLLNNLDQKSIVNKLYQSKFLVNTSRKESFGLSMAEAMSCAVPVIATTTDGSSEQIKDYYNGLIISETSPNIFRIKIEEALEINHSEYLEMSNNALSSSEKYKLPVIAKKVISEYKNLLNA